MVKPAGIVLFVYNRPEHTKATLAALAKNPLSAESEIYIYSDGPKRADQQAKVLEVRRIIASVTGFKSIKVRESAENMGLARSILAGVNDAFREQDSLIVLEDDIVTSPDFLEFMNSALDRYRDERSVFSISGFQFPFPAPRGYSYDAYLSYRASSWGWGTWKDRWAGVDWSVADYSAFQHDRISRKKFNRGGNDLASMLDRQMAGKIDSWAIRWAYAHFKAGAYCLYPVRSRVENIGFDGSGTHCAPETVFSSSQPLTGTGGQLSFPRANELNQEILNAVYGINSTPMGAKIRAWFGARYRHLTKM